MKFKNFPMVPRVVFGRGSFIQLAAILAEKRALNKAPFVFLVDDVFKSKAAFMQGIVQHEGDQILWVSAKEEPKTSQVDALVAQIKGRDASLPSGVIGIGGGSVMDIAKAVSIMLTNPGATHEYQGWDLVKQPAVWHVGIPTISGTGAEVSRTTVLTGPTRKLGINSDYTPFDQVILDPELTSGVPKEKWFYTGMDCFIHCVESLNGSYINAFSQSYGEKAYELCEQVFLSDLKEEDAQDKLMMASWHGGMSIAYSQVGVAHAMSYGLSYVLGTRHGLGNCLVFDKLESYYPEGVRAFKAMKDRHGIQLPEGVCSSLSDDDFNTMIRVALSLEPLWENALGKDWKKAVTPSVLRGLYESI